MHDHVGYSFWSQNVGDSPLHRACDRGNVMVTQLLLKAGANVDVPGGVRLRSVHACSL